ncbi:hypothetical protein OH77DRAFT_1156763 [Trametes cingulata]|nr:hypothetical protein OH77DRAFT_1156763 [Trametes cingulata]
MCRILDTGMPTTNAAEGPASVPRSRKRALESSQEDSQKKRKRVLRLIRDVQPYQPGPARIRCTEFDYPDGNIIVAVKTVEFKLHLSRLMRTCDFFSRKWAFDYDADQTGTSQISANGRGRVYQNGSMCIQKLDNLDAAEFSDFLRALEDPCAYVIEPPTQGMAISLLRTATRLGCESVRKLARHRLEQLWPCTIDQKLTRKGHVLAIEIISAAREFDLPQLLKRAFYELIRSTTFWKRVETERPTLALSDADLLMLYQARHVLQQHWRELVFVPPRLQYLACLCRHFRPSQRQASWSAEIVKWGDLQKGEEDPIGYLDTFKWRAFENKERLWCRKCLNQSATTWLEAKREWWKKLDGLLKLA